MMLFIKDKYGPQFNLPWWTLWWLGVLRMYSSGPRDLINYMKQKDNWKDHKWCLKYKNWSAPQYESKIDTTSWIGHEQSMQKVEQTKQKEGLQTVNEKIQLKK